MAATPSPAPPPSAPVAPAANPGAAQFDQSMGDLNRLSTPDEGEEAAAPPAPPAKAPAKAPVKAPAKAPVKAPAGKPADPVRPGDEPVAPVKAPDDQEGEEGHGEAEVKPGEEGKPGRPSPWKLVDTYKARNRTLEKELADLRTGSKELPKEHQERFTAIETRNKELEEEIRFTNYSKSKEFEEQFQKPYQKAWTKALADLRELPVTNEDGSTRPATHQDIVRLANMPLGAARKEAKEMFGDCADDIMAHCRTIRDLSDKQNEALEEAKKNGSEREARVMEERRARMKARAEETGQVWNTVNKEAVDKYEYLRPVEGEAERNEKLDKARAFVDETFGLDVGRAKTQEERDNIIRRHAALRNRAIGFSVLKHENTSLRSKVAELEKALSEYQGSEPTNGSPPNRGGGDGGGDTMDSIMAGLGKLAS